MPLRPGAKDQIRSNLLLIASGKRAPLVIIADLTPEQLGAINAEREFDELPPIIAEVVFIGKHLYNSRIARDGYSIDEVIEQVESATSEESIYKVTQTMTAIKNPTQRTDSNGKAVNDMALLECSKRHPRPELISVVPTGDGKTPQRGQIVTTGATSP